MNVKDSDPSKTHFMQIKVSKDGQPIGIVVKRRDQNNNQHKKQNKKRKPKEQSDDDEIQEIIGVRVPDDDEDRMKIYRNAIIVNNTLIMKKLLFSSFS